MTDSDMHRLSRSENPRIAERTRRRVFAMRGVFALYAIGLATLTHWPALSAGPAPFNYFDKFLHLGAFGLWTLLLLSASFWGPALANRNLVRTGIVALFVSGLDEATQAIPMVNRHASWSDYLANTAGVLIAIGLAGAWARLKGKVHKSC